MRILDLIRRDGNVYFTHCCCGRGRCNVRRSIPARCPIRAELPTDQPPTTTAALCFRCPGHSSWSPFSTRQLKKSIDIAVHLKGSSCTPSMLDREFCEVGQKYIRKDSGKKPKHRSKISIYNISSRRLLSSLCVAGWCPTLVNTT